MRSRVLTRTPKIRFPEACFVSARSPIEESRSFSVCYFAAETADSFCTFGDVSFFITLLQTYAAEGHKKRSVRRLLAYLYYYTIFRKKLQRKKGAEAPFSSCSE